MWILQMYGEKARPRAVFSQSEVLTWHQDLKQHFQVLEASYISDQNLATVASYFRLAFCPPTHLRGVLQSSK
jgi:hypothetical protein